MVAHSTNILYFSGYFNRTMKERAELEIYSVFAIIGLVISRVVLLVLIIYCVSAWSENEIVISIFIFILGFLLAGSGIDKIMIYADRFEHVSTSMLSFLEKKRTVYFSHIRLIEVQGNANALTEILTGNLRWNKIFITTDEQEILAISTYLDIHQLQKAAAIINQRLTSRRATAG